MLVYQGSVEQFVLDVRENRIDEVMSANFVDRWGRRPSNSELTSWKNSLPKVRDLIEIAKLKENMIALEYEAPYSQSRIDCLLFGKGSNGYLNIFLVELKQWTSVKALEDEGNYVETYTGGAERIVPHPSEQVKGYHNYLKGFISELAGSSPMFLFSCAYCHNYSKDNNDGLFNPKYKELTDEFPVYCKEETNALANRMKSFLALRSGVETFNRFMQSPLRPSRKLLDHVSSIIKGDVVFSLLNEQLVAKNLILSKVLKAERNQSRSIIIVYGGPGTGKSLIALNILAETAYRGKEAFYGCKSKPFLNGLMKLVGKQGVILCFF